MNLSMLTAAGAIQRIQHKVDNLGSNISNLDTVGYKRLDTRFREALIREVDNQPAHHQEEGRLTPLQIRTGVGLGPVVTFEDLQQGTLKETNNPLDLALTGDGFLLVQVPRMDEDGAVVDYDTQYTRAGNLQWQLLAGVGTGLVNTTGDGKMLVNANGLPILDQNEEPIILPYEAEMRINEQGEIYAITPDYPEGEYVTQLGVASFSNPQLLRPQGGGRYQLVLEDFTSEDGTPELDEVRQWSGSTAVQQGTLEMSNINLADEMTELLQTQRALQFQARAFSSADRMWELANNIRRA